MRNAFCTGFLLMILLAAGCATPDARHEQCGRMAFRHCLDVDVATCDRLFDEARQVCQQKMQANLMFDNMPDNMRDGYHNRCIVQVLVERSGQDENETRSCLKW